MATTNTKVPGFSHNWKPIVPEAYTGPVEIGKEILKKPNERTSGRNRKPKQFGPNFETKGGGRYSKTQKRRLHRRRTIKRK